MIRVGNGYDVHRFKEGRRLILGGVEIENPTGLDGHSDADVLLHAVSDALLGAAALGDIGKLFPDNDDKYLGADSLELLKEVKNVLCKNGFSIVNIDSILVMQKPKVAPYILKMRENIAKACEIDIANVSVKATTEEKLGFTGALQGASAHAVCLIEQK